MFNQNMYGGGNPMMIPKPRVQPAIQPINYKPPFLGGQFDNSQMFQPPVQSPMNYRNPPQMMPPLQMPPPPTQSYQDNSGQMQIQPYGGLGGIPDFSQPGPAQISNPTDMSPPTLPVQPRFQPPLQPIYSDLQSNQGFDPMQQMRWMRMRQMGIPY